jgi:hypothetical protein
VSAVTAPNGPLHLRAVEVIPGVVAARQRGASDDARLLIEGYLEDAHRLQASPAQAYSMLFSAATVWVSTLVDCRAFHHQITPTRAVQELAGIAAGVIAQGEL